MEDLPPIGDNAFTNGLLNRAVCNNLINRVNSQGNGTVALPPGAGSGTFIYSEENFVLDLRNAKFPSGATSNLPFACQVATTLAGSSVTVSKHSRLITSIDQNNTLAISNLNTALAISNNQCVVLKYDVGGNTASIIVQNISSYKPIVWANPSMPESGQDSAYVVIGYVRNTLSITGTVVEIADGSFKPGGSTAYFIQCVYSDVMIEQRCYGGVDNALVLVPWFGGILLK